MIMEHNSHLCAMLLPQADSDKLCIPSTVGSPPPSIVGMRVCLREIVLSMNRVSAALVFDTSPPIEPYIVAAQTMWYAA